MDTTQDNIVLRHAETDEELRACFDVMHELRPRLPDASDFLTRVKRMRQAKGYRLLAVWQLDMPVALAGYEVSENLIH
ncbi:MAG: GNAT family N-acetyltransferase, partial [Pusillimonas sp.]